jgi:dolichol-phosphate mannosyltransferase
VDEVTQAFKERKHEIIFVDDGSDDGSWALLQHLRTEYPQMRALRHSPRSGQSTAIWNGVKAARAAVIGTLDGDGQNDPADLPALLHALHHADREVAMVAGWRTQRQDSRVKLLSSRIANLVRRTLLRDGTPDTGCGIKVFYREVFMALPYFDHMHRFLPALVQRTGRTVISVPVQHRPRRQGKSKYGVWNRLWVGIVDLLGVSWLIRRSHRPSVEELN